MPKKLQTFRRTFTFNGTTIDRKFSTKKLANEWYDSMKKRSERVRSGLAVGMDDVNFEVGAARWLIHRMKTTDYWSTDEAKMRRAFVPQLGRKVIRGITKADCEEALYSTKHDRKLSDATFNRYRACLHTFFEYAIDAGYRDTNPVTKVEIKPESPRGVFVSDDDVFNYLEKARLEKVKWFFPLAVLAMNAGPRSGELLGFNISDFNADVNHMTISRRYQVMLKRVKDGTKGGAARAIPLNHLSIAAITEFLAASAFKAPETPLFHDLKGKRASGHTLSDIHDRVAKAAGLSDSVRFQDITRHKFASKLVKETGNMRLAQLILGHSTVRMTERYEHSDPAHVINRAVGVTVGERGKVLN